MSDSPHPPPVLERIPREERLLNLLAFLLSRTEAVTSAEIRVTVSGYREDLSASDATYLKMLHRDLDDLEAIGVPVEQVTESETARGGWRVPRERYYLPSLELSALEALVLEELARSPRARGTSEYARTLRSAIQKLVFDRPTAAEEPLAGLGRALVAAADPPSLELDLVLAFAAAAAERRVVRFAYHAMGDDHSTRRTLAPYGLRHVAAAWYLVGLDLDRDQIRTFKVARVRPPLEPIGNPAAFTVPDDFELDAHVPGRPWRVAAGSGELDVTVRVDPELRWLAERELAGGGVRQTPDGLFIITTNHLPALLRMLTRWLAHVEVVAPPAARRAYVELLSAARARLGADA